MCRTETWFGNIQGRLGEGAHLAQLLKEFARLWPSPAARLPVPVGRGASLHGGANPPNAGRVTSALDAVIYQQLLCR